MQTYEFLRNCLNILKSKNLLTGYFNPGIKKPVNPPVFDIFIVLKSDPMNFV